MISTPLRMEKPVRRPIVPPISPSWGGNIEAKFVYRNVQCTYIHTSVNTRDWFFALCQMCNTIVLISVNI